MRRLAITGFCAIALLSGCAKPGVPNVAGGGGSGPPIKLPCPDKNAKTGDHHVGTSPTTVHFQTGGNCKFTDFSFVGPDGKDPPPNFKRQPVTLPSATILYDYDAKEAIPADGYEFTYINDDSKSDGNGSGVVKN